MCVLCSPVELQVFSGPVQKVQEPVHDLILPHALRRDTKHSAQCHEINLNAVSLCVSATGRQILDFRSKRAISGLMDRERGGRLWIKAPEAPSQQQEVSGFQWDVSLTWLPTKRRCSPNIKSFNMSSITFMCCREIHTQRELRNTSTEPTWA